MSRKKKSRPTDAEENASDRSWDLGAWPANPTCPPPKACAPPSQPIIVNFVVDLADDQKVNHE